MMLEQSNLSYLKTSVELATLPKLGLYIGYQHRNWLTFSLYTTKSLLKST